MAGQSRRIFTLQRKFDVLSLKCDIGFILNQPSDDGRDLAKLVLEIEKNRIQAHLDQKKANLLAEKIESNKAPDKKPDNKKSSNQDTA